MKTKLLTGITHFVAAIAVASLLSSGCAAQSTATQTELARQGAEQGTETASAHPGLLDPTKATEKAPEQFQVKFQTTKGDITVDVTRAWAPNGADRFYNMVRVGYFKDVAIFRAIDGFMFQFGIHGNPDVAAKWSESNIQDDPSVGISNTPATLSFAQTGQKNSRSVQMFVNLGNNAALDVARGGGAPFLPFGKISAGLDVVQKINTEYGENPRGEDIQGNFKRQGNEYILKKFPNIDIIRSATIID